MPRFVTLGVLLTLVALTGGNTLAQAPPPGQIEEMVLLNNDSVRLVLITYAPGADSDLHLNVGPEVTIVQEGELVMFAQGRREVLHPGEAHWLPDATTHLARNEGARPVKFWSLLLKRCD
jgi:quercetin dioxygenase-like cupin family protein